MSSLSTRCAVAFLILLLAWNAVACGSAPQPTPTSPAPTAAPQADGASLLQARCTRCHSLDRVQQSPRTSSEWQTVVSRMRSKGAQLNDAEAQLLVQHLTQTYGK